MRSKGLTLIELLVIMALLGIFLALLIPLFTNARNAAQLPEPVWVKDSRGYDYQIVTIDGCEYIYLAPGMIHKGNCKACLQRQGWMKAEREGK